MTIRNTAALSRPVKIFFGLLALLGFLLAAFRILEYATINIKHDTIQGTA